MSQNSEIYLLSWSYHEGGRQITLERDPSLILKLKERGRDSRLVRSLLLLDSSENAHLSMEIPAVMIVSLIFST
jgi:hypothetical protein